MPTTFKIHPAIGIARLGDSADDFYLSPEAPGVLPVECDRDGRPKLNPDGTEQRITTFRDPTGRVKRQAARFRVYVYDDQNPAGREVKFGDTIQVLNKNSGQLIVGEVVDVTWTVYLANKKASWYEFQALNGEHGYTAAHPLRNAAITDPTTRQSLIIDPGAQSVGLKKPAVARASFARGKNPGWVQSFPPPLQPSSIDTLGDLKVYAQDNSSRLIVLGGHGNSGSFNQGFGEPSIQAYANNDGWFDDISDGPVSAQIVYNVVSVDGQKPFPPPSGPSSLNVDDPAWVIVGYPRYAPQITDIVTMEDLVYDVAVREFAYAPNIYGNNKPVPTTPEELQAWRTTAKYNAEYLPYFWRDIWPILKRPYDYQWVMDFNPMTGGDPHNSTPGANGNLDPKQLSVPPHLGEDPGDARRRAGQRAFIYAILRKPGQENSFTIPNPRNSSASMILMPYLCGDNPLADTPDNNLVVSKFLRLTDTQLFLLKQWAEGKFINERDENFPVVPLPPGEALDRGVLSNVLGGAFCPGAETTWIMRNPAIYMKGFRIKPNRNFVAPPPNYQPTWLSLDTDLATGLEPGDITKYSGLPWQSDFNECSTQDINITYRDWNFLDLASIGDPKVPVIQNTYWWPAHRPMMVFNAQGAQVYWSTGIPQTYAGDLAMVTAWKTLGFIKDNPAAAQDPTGQTPAYIVVEAQNL